MFTILANGRHRSAGRPGNGAAAAIAAIAMAVIVSSPVSAVPLKRDLPGGTVVVVDPARSDGATSYPAKLRTTKGYHVLVYG